MNLRTQKNLLLVAAAVMAVASVACLATAVLLPPSVPQTTPTGGGTAPSAVTGAGKPEPLNAYAAIWQRDVRKPLEDPEALKVQPPKPPPVPVVLIGTVVEPGFTYGLFQTKKGEQKLVRAGESIEGAEVTVISEGSAQVRWHGKLITLKVKAK
ncbi:MAG: hypothetical protein KAU28_04045, partial [Phycisphaerae bacterium]|nr:hypothetical protein [Phycisphaerae bacterium]